MNFSKNLFKSNKVVGDWFLLAGVQSILVLIKPISENVSRNRIHFSHYVKSATLLPIRQSV